MLFFKKKKKDDAIEIKAYFEGTVLPLEKVNDPMFSDKLMGDGVAIEPDAGNLYAPVDGKVASIFDTKHAIRICIRQWSRSSHAYRNGYGRIKWRRI